MKAILKKLFAAVLLLVFVTSCTNDDDATPIAETHNLKKIQELENTDHIVELYTENTRLEQGFNTISLKIKDKKTNVFIENASVNWLPMMHMTTMQHSCPYSEVQKTSGSTFYKGYIVFQMAQNETEYWSLTINYTINDTKYTVSDKIQVFPSNKQRVKTFVGTDNAKYVVALHEPLAPKVAVNDISMALFKMEDMMRFSVVDDYTIKIDPRMPSMGNHGSPNNVHLTQGTDGFYHGKLSLTMTGYWKINLQVLNKENQVLKGEEVTAEHSESSLYLEIEF
ncbi:MAG TPA: hypothetical protein VLY87_05470 [Flavobacterium sp.]|nr:hypothetical protein [Flavobacterium sp.]